MGCPGKARTAGVTFPTLAEAYDADGEELEEHTILLRQPA